MMGLLILMVVMIVAFSTVLYKMNVFYARNRLILDSDGSIRKVSVISQKEALTIEIKDFMCSFYNTFYSFNQYNIDSCLNLGFYKGDESLRNLYAQYKNDGWYNTIIQENVSQTSAINMDGFQIDVNAYPYKVAVNGLMTLRQGDVVRKFRLNGTCTVESVTPNFPRNPHGLFIRGWREDKHEL